MRRGPLLVLVIVVGGAGLALLGAMLRAKTGGPHSIVLITLDTTRADRIGQLTPRLAALAARSVVFENAWTVAPITVPAHATLLTGRLPPQHGLRTNRSPARLPRRADRAFATLPEAMRSAGARTGAFVSASVLRADRTGLDAGFDVYDEVDAAKPGSLVENERRGEDTVAKALAWIGKENDGRPFFVWVHLFDPHGPYDAPAPWGAGPSQVSTSKGYDAEIAYTDACVGKLLDGLAALGHEDAIVCVTADHGEGLGEHGEATHGFLLHEATLHVPLLLTAPPRGIGSRRVADPVSIAEVAPTLLALADVAVPDGMPDHSLLDAPPAGGRVLYAETLYGYDAFRWAKAFALRKSAWKLVDAGSAVRTYDLESDPGEATPTFEKEGNPSSPLVRDALAKLRGVQKAAVAATGPATTLDPGGPYIGSSADLSPYDEDANRKLPNPYQRIGELETMHTAQVLLQAGAAAKALELLDEVVLEDANNPELQQWRGRALHALKRPTDALTAFRRALDLGNRDPACVEKSLQIAVAAALGLGAAPSSTASYEGLDLAHRARALAVPETAEWLWFEAKLHQVEGDLDAANACLARARTHDIRDPKLPAMLNDLENEIRRAQKDR